MSAYSWLKLLNTVVYLISLCLAIGYFSSMKYNSQFTYYMFESVLIMRPVLILSYTLLVACRVMQYGITKPNKVKN